MSNTNGIRTLDQMLIGYDVLQWSQAERLERIARARVGLAHECGWLAEWVGPHPNLGWELFATGSGVLRTRSEDEGAPDDPFPIDRVRPIGPFLGIDRDGNVLEIDPSAALLDEDDAQIIPPDDGVWRTLIARYTLTPREPGTLTLVGGSTAVVGVGTGFTRYSADADPEATILRIDATDTVDNNDGLYAIETIIDDTNLTLLSAPSNSESGVHFRVMGQFFSGAPADPDIHYIASVRWELVTRTTTRPTDGLIAYDARRSAGVVSLIDRRRGSIYQPYTGRSCSFTLIPASNFWNNLTSTYTIVNDSFVAVTGGGAGTATIAMSMAPAATGSHLTGLAEDQPTGMMLAYLFDNGATRTIRVKHYTTLAMDLGGSGNPGDWDDPDNGSAVDVIAAVGLLDVALIALPASSGFTHICFYLNAAGDLFSKTSADNGATWVGPATVWAPSGSDTLVKVDAVLTRLNRIVVVVKYSVSAQIRAIYSDDLGATWDKNVNAGYTVGTGTTVHDVSICEDDRGNLWTTTAQGVDNTVRMFRGQAEGDASPDSGEVPTGGWKVGAEDTAAFANRIDSFALPNGVVCAVFDVGDTIDEPQQVNYVAIARKQAIIHETLVFAPFNSGISACAVAVGVAASGMIFLAYSVHTSSSESRIRFIRYIPAAVERSHSWYGGT